MVVFCLFTAPPLLVTPVQDTVVVPGSTAMIRCDVIGDPLPIVTWTKQGGELPLGR